MPDVATQLVAVIERPISVSGLLATILDAFRGLACATAVAVPLGVLIGMFPGLERATRVIVDFGRSFPVIALLPILVLLFGATLADEDRGDRASPASSRSFCRRSTARAGSSRPSSTPSASYRIPARLRFFKVLLPAAGPYIATGMRIATTVADPRLGRRRDRQPDARASAARSSLSRSYNETATAFAYIVYAGLLGVALTVLWDVLEARLLRWHLRAKAE